MTDGRPPRQNPSKPRDLCERTFLFGRDAVRRCLVLGRTPGVHRHIAGQLVDAATSVGANTEEARAAHSRADFIFKNGLVLREARESLFWLRLILASELMTPAQVVPLRDEADELVSIFTKLVRTARASKS